MQDVTEKQLRILKDIRDVRHPLMQNRFDVAQLIAADYVSFNALTMTLAVTESGLELLRLQTAD